MCQSLEEIFMEKFAKEATHVNNLTVKLVELNRIDDIIKATTQRNIKVKLFFISLFPQSFGLDWIIILLP